MIGFGRHILGGREIVYIKPTLAGGRDGSETSIGCHKRYEAPYLRATNPLFDVSASRKLDILLSFEDKSIDAVACKGYLV